jgi:hypothetical protein
MNNASNSPMLELRWNMGELVKSLLDQVETGEMTLVEVLDGKRQINRSLFIRSV